MLVNAYFNSEGEMFPRCRFQGTLQKFLKLLTLVSKPSSAVDFEVRTPNAA